MRSLVIGVDVDDVTLDLLPEWLRRYNARYADNLKPADITSWDCAQFTKPECGDRFYDILHGRDLYDRMAPVAGAIEGITQLRAMGHRVVFVSTCVGDSARRKIARLVALGVLDPKRTTKDFFATSDKGLVRLDVLIDDGPHNFTHPDTFGILFDRPHNHDAVCTPPVWRAHSWGGVVKAVADLSANLAPAAEATAAPPTPAASLNPKDLLGASKLPLHLWPASATAMGCLGLLEGALKYGRVNWRSTPVSATTYIAAALRHLQAYAEGEDRARDSNNPHLANALASIAILVDAGASGTLVDDRNYRGAGYGDLVEGLTPQVNHLKQLFADKHPKHWTIADEQPVPVTSGAAFQPSMHVALAQAVPCGTATYNEGGQVTHLEPCTPITTGTGPVGASATLAPHGMGATDGRMCDGSTTEGRGATGST